jgi:hypothetical protein
MREGDQLLHDPLAIRPAVDEVAEDDERVLGPRVDRLDQRVECRRATADVADGDAAIMFA